MTSTTIRSPASAETLRQRLSGRLVVSGDAGYEVMRVVVSRSVDCHQAALARVADAADVATVIAIARDQLVEPAVRRGGQETAGDQGRCDLGNLLWPIHNVQPAA